MPQAQVNRIALPYHSDSALLFQSIRSQPYPALLDSSSYPGPFGRFDILCADPSQLLSHDNLQTTLTQRDGSSQILDALPFDALRQLLLDQGFDGQTTPNLPFTGGALGYFSYDLGRCYAPLANLATDDINQPQMQIGIYQWAIIVDHQLQCTTLVSHNLSDQQLQTVKERFSDSAAAKFSLTSPFQSNLDKDAYLKRFRQVIDYIHAGDCYQVNLAQRFSCTYQGDPWCAYLALRRQTHTPFSAYLESPAGSLLSLSPERFLQVADSQVETRPIKGTRPRHPLPEQDAQLKTELTNSVKDRAENLMIVDLLRNDLGRSCITGSVRVPELFKIESYANVHHLVTAITGELAKPIDVIDLLQGCFPGGSITGAPKTRAMQIIEELEPHRRSAYCGSIGYIGFNGGMDSNICIRTLVATQDKDPSKIQGQLHCWAGGGIVADSDGDAEYQETFDKVNNLIQCLEGRFLKP
ncbi:MAG: aminodeoxychorismate synthase component I [Halopseudomonas sp.]